MGEALISGAGGGAGAKIYRWKRYNVNETTNYIWNRYNVLSTTTYKWNKWNVVSGNTIYKWNQYTIVEKVADNLNSTNAGLTIQHYDNDGTLSWFWSGFTITSSSSGYGYVPSGRVVPVRDAHEEALGLHHFGRSGSSTSGPYVNHHVPRKYSSNSTGAYIARGDVYNIGKISSQGSFVGSVTSTNRYAYPDNGTSGSYWYTYSGSEVEYSKGTTLYGQVTSTSSSAYPSNGKSGSYWYVSAGSDTSYSKGSTQYPDVTSTNRLAYPDNNYSGSYWYVYSTSSTTYSQGSYIDDVFGTDPNLHPQNGKDGSYWYVYSGEAN